jgi:glutathione synthase/RimK-type ligase-like ATP-grasp enzyme
VGEKIFTAGIDTHRSETARVDFRSDYPRLEYVPFDLPGSLGQRLVALTSGFGLTFGAIDLIVTPDGRFVFLEINQSGQWAWLEMELGLPISEAITDALENATTGGS